MANNITTQSNNSPFTVVKASEVPSGITRTGRSGKWTQAVELLRGLNTGEGLSILVPHNELGSARGGIVGAVNRLGKGMKVATRTQAVEGDENSVTLYIIKTQAGEGCGDYVAAGESEA